MDTTTQAVSTATILAGTREFKPDYDYRVNQLLAVVVDDDNWPVGYILESRHSGLFQFFGYLGESDCYFIAASSAIQCVVDHVVSAYLNI